MAGPIDALGPILEVMTWVGFVPGVPLLVWGWIIARRRCSWTTATGEVFETGTYKGLRWIDGGNNPRLSLVPHEEARELVSGSQVVLHYDVCHPTRFGLVRPRHENIVLILGWILTSVGILCTIAGFVVMVLSLSFPHHPA